VDYKKALRQFQKESNEEGSADSQFMLGISFCEREGNIADIALFGREDCNHSY
jgi:hypothetical protein